MVGTVVRVTTPVLMVILLKVMAELPLIFAAPAKLTVPVPCVKVLLFVNEPEAAMVKVPAPDHASVPLLVTAVAVNAPEAPKVRL